MKCQKCGTELGQKNICPVCSAGKKSQNTSLAPDVSVAVDDKLENFVMEHLDSWENEFDDFFDKLEGNNDYRECVSKCSRWREIFNLIQELLPASSKIPAGIMLKIMDEIPALFPEVTEDHARKLAKEFKARQLDKIKNCSSDQPSDYYITIPKDECTQCEACLTVCPIGAISHKLSVCVDTGMCVGCGACVDACPIGIIKMQRRK